MKLVYVENMRLPTEKAHGYQIMKTIDAIRCAGVDIELVVAKRKNPLASEDPFALYNVRTRFPLTRLRVLDFISSVPKILKPFAFVLERWSFCRAIRRAPLIADIFYTRDVTIARALCAYGKPVIVELHSAPRSIPFVDGWVVISRALRSHLIERGVESERILVAPDAFDEEEFSTLPSRAEARTSLGISQDTFLVVYTGHLFPWKGIDGLAPAFARLPPSIHLAIVGGNPEDIERVKRAAGPAPSVTWTGFLPRHEARVWLAAADAALLPTSARFDIGREYTSPLKAFEYLAAGVPILASNVPSSRELLDETVAVFYRADDPEAFLEKIEEVRQRAFVPSLIREKASGHTWSERGRRIASWIEQTVRSQTSRQTSLLRRRQGLLITTQVVNDQDEDLGFFVAWLRRLASGGRPLHVTCWAHSRATILPPNVAIYLLPKGKLRRTIELLRLSWRLRREVSSVFVHMIAPVIVVCGWFWRLLGWKITLWYTHGSVPWSLRLAQMWSHQILTATEESMRIASPKKIVTGHGIDLTRFRPLSLPREALLLTVGRISPRKNQRAFIALCDRIHRYNPSLRFRALIVGDPRQEGDREYAMALADEIARCELASFVTIEPSKLGDELVALYSRAALFVSPSRTGSLDKVVLEALACETPVIAVGSSYQGLTGVTVVTSLTDETAIESSRAALLHPASLPEARAGVKSVADLDLLIERIRSLL